MEDTQNKRTDSNRSNFAYCGMQGGFQRFKLVQSWAAIMFHETHPCLPSAEVTRRVRMIELKSVMHVVA